MSHAWTAAFYSVHDGWRDALARRGWSSLVVAEETTFDPREFTLAGKAMQDVRSSVNRAARLGLRTRWATWSELPLRVTAQVTALSEDWMAEKELPELGFTLGGLDQLRDAGVLVGVVLDDDDRVQAITSWLPVLRDGVVVARTLDFMRRVPGGANGVMEFLIAEGIQRMGEEGLEEVSLSGSPVLGDAGVAGPLGRVLTLLGRTLEPAYGFRSLLRFKQKFSTRLRPLHLVYRDPVQLPAIGTAIARCYLPELGLRSATWVLAQARS